MNKSTINVPSAGTKADSSTTAQDNHVSQPNANTNVVGSLVGQREIKFRAWDYFNDVMIYDSDDETDFKFYNGKALVKYVTEQHTVENGIDIDRPVWNQVDGPVMQYTGLKDKNGTEIYEGDITNENRYFIFNRNGFWYKQINGEGNFPIVFWPENKQVEFEVIGNIFENPELLQSVASADKALKPNRKKMFRIYSSAPVSENRLLAVCTVK